MDSNQLEYLKAIGIDVYRSRRVRSLPRAEGHDAQVSPAQPPQQAPTIAVEPEPASATGSTPVVERLVEQLPDAAVEPPARQSSESMPMVVDPAADSVPPSADQPPLFGDEPPPPESPYAPSVAMEALDESAQPPAPPANPVASMDWNTLRESVASCEQCELCKTRTQSVFGVGDTTARVMVVGEAPGQDEDRQGEPFVGRAGKLLDLMLKAAGFERKDVFIANILKCRPPNNRDPKAEEALACRAYLNRQIELVGPDVILAVGRVSAQNLLDSQQAIGRLRGTVHRLPGSGVPVVVTYHPAYLLRSPSEKHKSWSDLQRMMGLLSGDSDESGRP